MYIFEFVSVVCFLYRLGFSLLPLCPTCPLVRNNGGTEGPSLCILHKLCVCYHKFIFHKFGVVEILLFLNLLAAFRISISFNICLSLPTFYCKYVCLVSSIYC